MVVDPHGASRQRRWIRNLKERAKAADEVAALKAELAACQKRNARLEARARARAAAEGATPVEE